MTEGSGSHSSHCEGVFMEGGGLHVYVYSTLSLPATGRQV
jgi:hypothetical protein